MEALKKIALIVDDSATARIMLARVLNTMEIDSRQAKSGEEALQMIKSDQPNLIFLDHLMPGMDGFQTLRVIKSNPSTRNIPVIMYTSQNAPKYQEEARVLGAYGVITKQVDRNQLYLLVEKAFMQRELENAPGYEAVPADTLVAANEPEPVILDDQTERPISSVIHEQSSGATRTPHDDWENQPERRLHDSRHQRLLSYMRQHRFWITLLGILVVWGGYRLIQANERIEKLESALVKSAREMAEISEIISIMQESRKP
ncbi:MAG: response regulator [Hahellaceae bacterium]|jgi:CheY-like chemotaxis protein|nr:response regulator [Hahellaceae bacterium]